KPSALSSDASPFVCPPVTSTRPSSSLTPLGAPRACVMSAAALKRPVASSNASTLAVTSRPAQPPSTSTRPSSSATAAWLLRATARPGSDSNRLVIRSNTSTSSSVTSHPPAHPPVTRILPEGSRVAWCAARGPAMSTMRRTWSGTKVVPVAGGCAWQAVVASTRPQASTRVRIGCVMKTSVAPETPRRVGGGLQDAGVRLLRLRGLADRAFEGLDVRRHRHRRVEQLAQLAHGLAYGFAHVPVHVDALLGLVREVDHAQQVRRH